LGFSDLGFREDMIQHTTGPGQGANSGKDSTILPR
jgi:hypothetical protein